MTECERIIEKGIVPKDFFREEVLCDYTVTIEKKKLWALQIDLYLEFARVCESLGLRYFAMFGTALGAIRHNGFIPWDDDIDVVMPREDYEKLCNLYSKEFSEPYFLQTPYTDPGFYFTFAKLRNSNTAQILMPFKNCMFNQGVFMDIFPMDYCDPAVANNLYDEVYKHIMKCVSYMKKGYEHLMTQKQLENYYKYQTNNPLGEYQKIRELCMACNKKDYMGIPSQTIYKPSQLIWPTSCFDGVEYHKFENIEVALPKGWKQILTICYGDYMKYPPVEQRGTWHKQVDLDFEHSYKEYIDDNGNWMQTIQK